MKIFKLLIPLILFVIGGIYGLFSKDFVQINKPLFNWLLIPAIPIGIYYAFALTSRYPKNENGGIALGRFAITFLITMLVFRTAQGYLILYNCNVGRQASTNVKGDVIYTNFPKPKLIFGKYSINILLNDVEKITLEVPTKNYYVGQPFEKEMILGSLDILYSSN